MDGNYEPGNVRWFLPGQQNLNKRMDSRNKSGYRGVCWNARERKWRVTISLNHQQISVGQFKNLLEAAYMYDQYALQLYGNFVRTNFVYE